MTVETVDTHTYTQKKEKKSILKITRFVKKLTHFFFLDSGNKAKDSVGTGEFFLSL